MAIADSQFLDDRGVTINYRDPMFHGSDMNRADRDRVNGRRLLGSPMWAIGAITAAFVIQLVRLVGTPASTIVAHLAFTVGFTLVAWFFLLPPIRRMLWARNWKARYKSTGRCPACQYSLAELNCEADGCTVCPECGGAWRLPKQPI